MPAHTVAQQRKLTRSMSEINKVLDHQDNPLDLNRLFSLPKQKDLEEIPAKEWEAEVHSESTIEKSSNMVHPCNNPYDHEPTKALATLSDISYLIRDRYSRVDDLALEMDILLSRLNADIQSKLRIGNSDELHSEINGMQETHGTTEYATQSSKVSPLTGTFSFHEARENLVKFRNWNLGKGKPPTRMQALLLKNMYQDAMVASENRMSLHQKDNVNYSEEGFLYAACQEAEILDLVISEASRQVFAHCVERGEVIEKAKLHWRSLMQKLVQAMVENLQEKEELSDQLDEITLQKCEEKNVFQKRERSWKEDLEALRTKLAKEKTWNWKLQERMWELEKQLDKEKLETSIAKDMHKKSLWELHDAETTVSKTKSAAAVASIVQKSQPHDSLTLPAAHPGAMSEEEPTMIDGTFSDDENEKEFPPVTTVTDAPEQNSESHTSREPRSSMPERFGPASLAEPVVIESLSHVLEVLAGAENTPVKAQSESPKQFRERKQLVSAIRQMSVSSLWDHLGSPDSQTVGLRKLISKTVEEHTLPLQEEIRGLKLEENLATSLLDRLNDLLGEMGEDLLATLSEPLLSESLAQESIPKSPSYANDNNDQQKDAPARLEEDQSQDSGIKALSERVIQVCDTVGNYKKDVEKVFTAVEKSQDVNEELSNRNTTLTIKCQLLQKDLELASDAIQEHAEARKVAEDQFYQLSHISTNTIGTQAKPRCMGNISQTVMTGRRLDEILVAATEAKKEAREEAERLRKLQQAQVDSFSQGFTELSHAVTETPAKPNVASTPVDFSAMLPVVSQGNSPECEAVFESTSPETYASVAGDDGSEPSKGYFALYDIEIETAMTECAVQTEEAPQLDVTCQSTQVDSKESFEVSIQTNEMPDLDVEELLASESPEPLISKHDVSSDLGGETNDDILEPTRLGEHSASRRSSIYEILVFRPSLSGLEDGERPKKGRPPKPLMWTLHQARDIMTAKEIKDDVTLAEGGEILTFQAFVGQWVLDKARLPSLQELMTYDIETATRKHAKFNLEIKLFSMFLFEVYPCSMFQFYVRCKNEIEKECPFWIPKDNKVNAEQAMTLDACEVLVRRIMNYESEAAICTLLYVVECSCVLREHDDDFRAPPELVISAHRFLHLLMLAYVDRDGKLLELFVSSESGTLDVDDFYRMIEAAGDTIEISDTVHAPEVSKDRPQRRFYPVAYTSSSKPFLAQEEEMEEETEELAATNSTPDLEIESDFVMEHVARNSSDVIEGISPRELRLRNVKQQTPAEWMVVEQIESKKPSESKNGVAQTESVDIENNLFQVNKFVIEFLKEELLQGKQSFEEIIRDPILSIIDFVYEKDAAALKKNLKIYISNSAEKACYCKLPFTTTKDTDTSDRPTTPPQWKYHEGINAGNLIECSVTAMLKPAGKNFGVQFPIEIDYGGLPKSMVEREENRRRASILSDGPRTLATQWESVWAARAGFRIRPAEAEPHPPRGSSRAAATNSKAIRIKKPRSIALQTPSSWIQNLRPLKNHSGIRNRLAKRELAASSSFEQVHDFSPALLRTGTMKRLNSEVSLVSASGTFAPSETSDMPPLAADFRIRSNRIALALASSSKNARAKTMLWALRVISTIYASKVSHDLSSDRSKSLRASLPEFIFEYFKELYGTRSLVNSNTASLILTIVSLRGKHPDIDLFSQFLEEIYDMACLNAFLKMLGMMDNSRGGVKYSSTKTSDISNKYFELERCIEVMRATLGSSYQVSQCAHMLQGVVESTNQGGSSARSDASFRRAKLFGADHSFASQDSDAKDGQRVESHKFFKIFLDEVHLQHQRFKDRVGDLEKYFLDEQILLENTVFDPDSGALNRVSSTEICKLLQKADFEQIMQKYSSYGATEIDNIWRIAIRCSGLASQRLSRVDFAGFQQLPKYYGGFLSQFEIPSHSEADSLRSS